MRLIAITIAGTLILLAGGPPPAAEKPKPPKCDPDGRYWVHHDKGEKVYCFDGDGFAAASAPAHVKGYFEPAPSSEAGPVPKGQGPQMKNVGPGGSTAFPGVPSLPTGSSSSGGGGGFSLSGGGGATGGGGRTSPLKDLEKMMGGQQGSYDESEARGRARRDGGPLPSDAFDLVAVGMSRTQVQSKLGTPHGRIMNSGDDGFFEIWTYTTLEGGSGSVRIRNGRVISIRLP